MKKCQAIDSLKDLWWDIRPSPNYGTLELRICDGGATLEEVIAVVAFIHLLANWFVNNQDFLEKNQKCFDGWIARENKWRSIRDGLDSKIIIDDLGNVKNLKDDINDWIEKFGDLVSKYNYQNEIIALRKILDYGNSSSRQIKIFNKTKSLVEVMKFNVAEFNQQKILKN